MPTIDRKRKWLAFAAGYVIFCALYMLTGRIHLASPSPLPLLFIDRLIPFIGWTVWIYHTQFFILLFAVGALETSAGISRTLYSMGLASALSFCVFFFYPTELPRPTVETGGLTAQAFQLLYAIDPATNCFPSLHVALAWLAALGVAEERARAGTFAVVWAALISLSTMTTKQHYFIDVMAGVLVAGVCRALAKGLLGAGKSLVTESD
ncbi:MAG TPA: phosphatase PAP2 family protein [Blastocatellia bacterium]|nr:phosphatase PAP2 family protein [Blastocatellia bacterium]